MNGTARAHVEMLFPEDPEIREEDGLNHDAPDAPVKFLAFSNRTPALEQKFITVVHPRAARGCDPHPATHRGAVARIQLPRVRVRSKDRITDVYLNLQADGRRMHLNSNNTIASWETDAYLFAVTQPAAAEIASMENVTRYFVAAGSYLRRGGRVVLDSVSKVDALFRPGVDVDLHVNGQDTIDLALTADVKPARINVNGKPTPFRYTSDQQLARLRVRASRSAISSP